MIERAEGVCGGDPVIQRTRIPVSYIGELHDKGVNSLDIHRMLGGLVTLRQLQAALNFYRTTKENK